MQSTSDVPQEAARQRPLARENGTRAGRGRWQIGNADILAQRRIPRMQRNPNQR